MTDGEAELGYVSVEIFGDTVTIHEMKSHGYDFTVPPDAEHSFILDSLMRAAASYGETHGMSKVETAFPDFFSFLEARHFETDEHRAFASMDSIIHYL